MCGNRIRCSRLVRQPGRASVVIAGVLVAVMAIVTHPGPLAAQAGDAEIGRPLRVVIKPLIPFVIVEGDAYRGFSIDLWQEIAARRGWDFDYQLVETVKEQLDTVEQSQADIAITGISITKAREEEVDFSLPYFKAGLQIMTPVGGSSGWTTPLQSLQALVGSPGFWRIIGGLALLILIMGHLFWLLERRRNPDFPQTYPRGVWEGIWYAVVTLVTVGYGDRTAKSALGRLAAMGWMFLSLFLVANFTANITSRLTLSHIQGAISGESDLPGKRIATVANSTAAMYLDDRRLLYTAVEVIEEAYALLEQQAVDAVVYDSPVLLYYQSNDGQGKAQTVGEIFEPQDYGIALPSGSPLREPLNQTLLEIVEDGTYQQIHQRWFSATGEGGQ